MLPIKDLNPAARTPVVAHLILALCILAYLWQIGKGGGVDRSAFSLGLIPAVVTGRAVLAPELHLVQPWATLVTSMFLHGGLLHLASNLLYLWIFAGNVEDRLGHVRFALLYLAAGLAAAGLQILPDPRSTLPMIGASGAISGVLGAYFMLFPRARVVVFIPISFMLLHEIRAAWLLAIWFVFQLWSAFTAPAGAGVAWWAHVGGFVAGALLVMPLSHRRLWRGRGPWG